VILISLYLMLGTFFLMKLWSIKDEYTRILGVGLVSAILVQAFVNIAVNIRLLPATGLTLPFISSWGTALIVNMLQVVLMYKILYQNTNKSTSYIALQNTKKTQVWSRGKLVM
jgi:cell division protein FtsW (lipid II flippase)